MRRSVEGITAADKKAGLSVDEVAAFTERISRRFDGALIDLKVRTTWGGRIKALTATITDGTDG